jgi:ABC-type histidine transport system ATPase subunit
MMANDISKFIFLDHGQVTESGNKNTLDKPSSSRVRRFFEIL